MGERIKKGTRVYHRNLAEFGVFVGYDEYASDSCYVNFGKEDQRCISESQLDVIPDEIFHQNYVEVAIDKVLKNMSDADPVVLHFIYDFMLGPLDTFNDESFETMRSTFMSGYCFYFAKILQAAFNRGKICLAAPFGHIVWLDDNNIPYDAEGVSTTEAVYFIPISYLGDGIEDFMHVAGKSHYQTKEDALNMLVQYRKDNNITDYNELEYCMKVMNFNEKEISLYCPKDISLLGKTGDAYRLKEGNYVFTGDKMRRDMIYENKEDLSVSGANLIFTCGKELARIPWGHDNYTVDGAVYLTAIDNYDLTFICDGIYKDDDGIYHIKGSFVDWFGHSMDLF